VSAGARSRRPRRTLPSLRSGLAVGLALTGLAWSVTALRQVRGQQDPRPNVIVIVTDDQSADSIPNAYDVMPFLQHRALDPNDHWVVFDHAYVNTPLCCPSRATMLTGRFPHHTGVQDNEDAETFDETSTIATWLHGAGYQTGLVGKYLNLYPFERPAYVPVGWDRWWARQQGPVTSLYYDYALFEQDHVVHYGQADPDYATDVLARKATEFIREAPADRPFFLWFAPTAPHPPWIPAPRDVGALAGAPVPTPPSVGEADVSDKPAWVRDLPPLDAADVSALRVSRRRSYRTLLAVDDAVRAITSAVRARGDLANTVVVFTSDNGLAFGEHRWTKKTCPYDACMRVPFMIRMPSVPQRTEQAVVSAADLAPTIADLAGVTPATPVDGVSLVPLLTTGGREGLPGEAFAEWVGDDAIPAWWEVRTRRFAYIELGNGERELDGLEDDPYELVNVVDDPAFANDVTRLAATLGAYRSA
jgi:N-acetylglucosamine-6-sulfatase